MMEIASTNVIIDYPADIWVQRYTLQKWKFCAEFLKMDCWTKAYSCNQLLLEFLHKICIFGECNVALKHPLESQ